jgi:hypothetical protein
MLFLRQDDQIYKNSYLKKNRLNFPFLMFFAISKSLLKWKIYARKQIVESSLIGPKVSLSLVKLRFKVIIRSTHFF